MYYEFSAPIKLGNNFYNKFIWSGLRPRTRRAVAALHVAAAASQRQMLRYRQH